MRRYMAIALILCALLALTLPQSAVAREVKGWRNYDELIGLLDENPPSGTVDLTSRALGLSECRAIRARYPGADFIFTLSIYKKRVRTDAAGASLGYQAVSSVMELCEYLEMLPNLRHLETLGTPFTKADMDYIAQRFPELDMLCKVRCGNNILLTDVTAYCTKHALYTKNRHTQEDFAVLKYCKSLKALDVGHNSITDLSFLKDLPQLQILILTDNDFTDITPLKYQTELIYLELMLNDITDVSVLADRPKLIDLHIGHCNITDVTPLLTDTGLDRLWLAKNPIPETQIQALREALPNCTINTTATVKPTAEGWRQGHPRYLKIARIFQKGRYEKFP